MTNFTALGHGILKGIGRERPNDERVFVPFPTGITLEEAQRIEQGLNDEVLEHFHIEAINDCLFLHLKPDETIEKYLKMKEKLAQLS